MSEQKKLYRNTDTGIIGGVCAGLGDYLKIDPVLIRIIFGLLAINGIGLVAYFLMWMLLPDQAASEEGEDLVRANLNEMADRTRRLARSSSSELLIGGALVAVGVLFLAQQLFPAIPKGLFWPAILIVLGIILLSRRS